jgi:hypothetical protein
MASMDTNSLINCISSLLISSISLASHHFLFHQYHLHLMHLITSYFINITYILCISSLLISLPFVINGQKDYSSLMLIQESFMTNAEWHWKSLSHICMESISSISNWSKRVLSMSNILFNDPWSFNDD